MTVWEETAEDLTREVVGSGHFRFAVVSCLRGGEVLQAIFAIPPDGEPTGRLWAGLEKRIPKHFVKISIRHR